MSFPRCFTILLVLALACGDSVEIPEEEGLFCEVRRDLLVEPSREIDLLLVVDSTSSMAALPCGWVEDGQDYDCRFQAHLERMEWPLPGTNAEIRCVGSCAD